MLVRALQRFTTEKSVVEDGDVLEMADAVAEVRIKNGLVERVEEKKPEAPPAPKVETATAPKAEAAAPSRAETTAAPAAAKTETTASRRG